jgi:hypothetical protein
VAIETDAGQAFGRPLAMSVGGPPQSLGLTVASIRQTNVLLLKSLSGAATMRRLLSLAVLVGILWAIDSYAFRGRYQAAALEEVNYYAQTLNDGVQRFVSRIRP